MKKFQYLFLLIPLFSSITFTQTYISPGNVSGTWTILDSPYYIQGDIIVPNDSTLTIEPGVYVEFLGHYALYVEGRLLALGTELNNITFTINDTTGFHNPDTTLGGWYGIRFIDTPQQNDTSKIIYCNISYGKAVGQDWFLNAGGAMCILHFDKIQISNCRITNCSAGGSGFAVGGALAVGWSDIRLTNNIFSNNHADAGGAIHFYESDPLLINNVFESNTATNGGAIDIQWKSHPVFSNDHIMNNNSSETGGALNIGGDSVVAVFNECMITGNTSHYGGAINAWTSEIHLNSCSLINNSASWIGGGINAGFSNVQINNTTFEKDTAHIFGGAMGIYNSILSLDNSNLIDNGAGILGGGIHSDFSTINISNSIFERDTSGESGGGMFLWHCDLNMINTDFNENSSLYNGGAICSDSSSLNINSSDFFQNNAASGGAFQNSRSDIDIYNCQFVENLSNNGGAIYSDFSELNIDSCDFIGNKATDGASIRTLNANLFVDSCRFYQNEAINIGGGILYHIDTTEFTNPYLIEISNSSFSQNLSFNRAAIEIQQFNSETSLVDVNIDKCEFINNIIDRGGNLLINGYIKDFVISNSIFLGNIAALRTAACQFSNNVSGEIFNCLFIHNQTPGGGSASAIGIGSKVNFINCTFAYNSGAAAITLRNDAHSILINDIFWGNENYNFTLSAVTDSTPCELHVNYCDIQYGLDSIVINDTISVVSWGSGNVDFDPLFVDTLNNDFHLQDLSTCLAAGVDSIEIAGFWYHAPVADIEGNQRPYPVGTMPDMGAYESQYPVNIEEQKSDLPIEFSLSQNYPNPFNPVTIIEYQIPEAANVTIKILDVLGSEVLTLVEDYKAAGTHEVKYNAEKLASGVYFYQLRVGNFISTKKMVLMK